MDGATWTIVPPIATVLPTFIFGSHWTVWVLSPDPLHTCSHQELLRIYEHINNASRQVWLYNRSPTHGYRLAALKVTKLSLDPLHTRTPISKCHSPAHRRLKCGRVNHFIRVAYRCRLAAVEHPGSVIWVSGRLFHFPFLFTYSVFMSYPLSERGGKEHYQEGWDSNYTLRKTIAAGLKPAVFIHNFLTRKHLWIHKWVWLNHTWIQ